MGRQNALAELAHGTGEIFFHDNNDMDGGLRRVAAAPKHSYILALLPQHLKQDGSLLQLKVVMKGRKDAEVRARLGYFAPQGRDPLNAAAEGVRGALFSGLEASGLPAELQTGIAHGRNHGLLAPS